MPSTHTKQPIYAKFYLPKDFDASKKYPAVLFVHGAGYTQNVHEQWPYYFREQMFHNLLNEHGYVVLDMDYRASEGYGRDWRTAIYRQMGNPELEDLIDGVHWLEQNYSVDPNRIGVYGGSYGGFMTLMALFRAPDVFKAGAALRPVTDWTQYNHEYTSNILNDPAIDPIAYERSSPIEFADGLQRPPADRARHDRRQRAVRGFGAAVPEADRTAQGQLRDFAVSDGAARLRACGFVARRVQADLQVVRNEPQVRCGAMRHVRSRRSVPDPTFEPMAQRAHVAGCERWASQ